MRTITLEEIEILGDAISKKYHCIINISTNTTFTSKGINYKYVIVANRHIKGMSRTLNVFDNEEDFINLLNRLL